MQSVEQLEAHLSARLPDLSPAQRKGLAYGVVGTVRAGSACRNAVCSLRASDVAAHGRLRQLLRMWMNDKPTSQGWYRGPAVDVRSCFGPLLHWILSLWQGSELVLALDPTSHRDRVVSLAVSVVYRSCALPGVGWQDPASDAAVTGAASGLLSSCWARHTGSRPRRRHSRHVRPGDCQSAAVGRAGILTCGTSSTPTFQSHAGPRLPARAWVTQPGHSCVVARPCGARRRRPGSCSRINRRPRSMGCGGGIGPPRPRGPALAGHGSGHAAGAGLAGTLGCGWRMPPSSVPPCI